MLILVLLLVLLPHFALSQDYYDLELKPSQLKSTAKHAHRKADPYTEIAYLEKYLHFKKSDHKAVFRLGMAYRKARDYGKAEHWFSAAYEMEKEKNLLALYYEAEMMMNQGYHKEALEKFTLFRKKYRNQADEVYFRKMSKTKMEGCEMALSGDTQAKGVYAEHLSGVNFAYNELSPYPLSTEELIYSSLQIDTVIHFRDSLFEDTSIYHMRLFKAALENGEWVQKGEVAGDLNKKNMDVANLTLNAAGNRIYFTRCRKNWKYQNICQIYVSTYENGQWSRAEPIPGEVNHSRYTSTQPSIGVDPKKGHDVLYFVSDRPGGKGGLDIWYSEFKDGQFTPPRNCGSRVNTEGDESTPFYDSESNTLHFSSDGHPGFGGMDLFRAFGQKSKWIKEVENMKMPFNSPADDLYLIYGEDPKVGYLTSNRPGGIALKNPTCCDDIYQFEFNEFKIFNYKAVLLSEEGKNTEMISEASIEVYIRDKESGDTSLVKNISADSRGNINLKVLRDLNYLLIIQSEGHFRKTVKIPKDEKQRLYNSVDTIRLQKITEEAIVLKNIYYDFDDWTLTKKAEQAIDSFLLELLQLNPQIIVEISSHTDAKGSDEYNIRLSQKRAESVVSYLRKKGISRSRMIAKGYGKTRPIAPNKNPDGSDNPEGRQLNRRTEFRVIGFEEDIRSRR